MLQKSFLLNSEPKWIDAGPGKKLNIPDDARSWIFEPGSITQRLRSYYGDRVQVRIMFHYWQAPFFSEQRLLKLRSTRYALIREVLLYADQKPLILARTIIPESTIKGARRNLSHLGTRPLGEVIFSYPKLERLELNFTFTQPYLWTSESRQEAGINEGIWGRRTVYAIRHRKLLVNEFFLPEALRLK